MFRKAGDSSGYDPYLELADRSSKAMIKYLITKADSIVSESGVAQTSEDFSQKIYDRFRKVAPAEKCGSLANILNAAWNAFENQDLWKDLDQIKEEDRMRILKDLVLKNIEILEIENRLDEDA